MTAPHLPDEAPSARTPRVVRLGDPAVLLGGLAVLAFSFAPFVRYRDESLENLFTVTEVSWEFNAWSREIFMVPLTIFVVLSAVLAAGSTVARVVSGREPVLAGFGVRQLEVGLALFPSVVLLGTIASQKYALFGARRLADADPLFDPGQVAMATSWGAVLMLVGSLLALAGALVNHFGLAPTVTLGRAPQPAFEAPPGHGAPPGQQVPSMSDAPRPSDRTARPPEAPGG